MRIAVRLLLACPLVVFTHAGGSAAPSSWSFTSSVSARAGYDDNVFLQDGGTRLPSATRAAPAHAGSCVARVSAALDGTWRVTPALRLDAGYSPELVRYERFSGEHHDNHRLNLDARGANGPWSYRFDARLLHVDGAEESPVYGYAGGGPAIGGVGVRERRKQLATKLHARLERSLPHGFLRAVADFNANDFRARLVNTALVPGYANYVDRSEWSAGAEGGRFVRPEFALIAGVRVGEQRQANLLGVSHNYSNRLARLLVGVEGRPRADLTLRVLVGPDLRHYGDDVASGFDRSRTARYAEASATWTPRPADTVTFTVKDYLWVSSGGRGAYQHSTANLKWTHGFNPEWSLTLSADVQAGDSRAYAPGATERLDWIHTGAVGVTRTLDAKTRLDVELVQETGDSAVAHKPGREYTRRLLTVGVRRAF